MAMGVQLMVMEVHIESLRSSSVSDSARVVLRVSGRLGLLLLVLRVPARWGLLLLMLVEQPIAML